jgi:biopolymer transport protein ExbD
MRWLPLALFCAACGSTATPARDVLTDCQVAIAEAAASDSSADAHAACDVIASEESDRGRRIARALGWLDGRATVTIPLQLPESEPIPPSEPLEVSIALDGEGYRVHFAPPDGEESEHPFRRDASASEIDAAIPHPSTETPRAVIAADRQVAHSFFVAMIDALRRAGYSRYAVQVSAAPP